MTSKAETRTIELEQLARVEGESALRVRIEQGRATEVALAIFEPPRYFEALLAGRSCFEAPDIAARICGICPVAYQMSAVNALESAAGVTLPEPLQALRRLLYCGEWIESHVLHVHMLHAPDFFDAEDAVELARDVPEVINRALTMKKTGNALLALLGGREVHPINVRVGGFYRLPERAALEALVPRLEAGLTAAIEAARWTLSLPWPDYQTDAELVALRHDSEYPMIHGRIASTGGLDLPMAAFDDNMEEVQVPHSTALQARLNGGARYLTGPLARFMLNFDRLSPTCQRLAAEAGIAGGTRNPYQSIVVRAIEVVHAFEEALRIIADDPRPEAASVSVTPMAGDAAWATEAPRGLLFHRYAVNADGTIRSARIIPPTSQNQAVIEQDVAAAVNRNIDAVDAVLARQCENAIRNHDPCISCATHFLRITIDRNEDG